MKRRLIFNADDYGLSPGVCAGIRDACRGVVRSTTVMANLVSEADITALSGLDISIGLHLTLSCGPPLSRDYPRELRDPAGCFDKARALDAATWQHPEYRLAAWKEWQAQLSRLRELGAAPDHLDSHHHLHMLAPLFSLAVELAQELGAGLRARAGLVQEARRAGVAAPDVCIEDYFGDNTSRDDLLAALQPAPDGVVEVMCHPGYVDDVLRQCSAYLTERESELAVLGGPSLKRELEQSGWLICKYEPA